jgi:hypothetical protein
MGWDVITVIVGKEGVGRMARGGVVVVGCGSM